MFERKNMSGEGVEAGAIINGKSVVMDASGVYSEADDDKMCDLPVALKLIIRLSRLGMHIPYYTVDMDECAELIKNSLL
jgi:hypothetical protein